MQNLKTWLTEQLIALGINANLSDNLNSFILFWAVIFVAFLLRYLSQKIVVRWIHKILDRTKNTYDDLLIEHRIFGKLSHFVPGLIMLYSFRLIIDSEELLSLCISVVKIYISVVAMITLNAAVSALHGMYRKLPVSKNVQILGYVQVVKILIYVVGSVLILSVLLDQSPNALLTSLGAMAAILVLVFKDTILGFVANVQLSANNMVRPGDWITVKDKADGTVLDITLTTVKVQNFDKTISMLPTASLVQGAFVNWKAMEEGEGRRIKNSITILADSVQFADAEFLERMRTIPLLNEMVDSVSTSDSQSTNLGFFRNYIEKYLQKNHVINPDMTFLVRHLQNAGEGIPIEVYVFSKDKTWKGMETIQAEIMEHLYAIIHRFGLKVYQRVSNQSFGQ